MPTTTPPTPTDLAELLVDVMGVLRAHMAGVAADMGLKFPELMLLRETGDGVPMGQGARAVGQDPSRVTLLADSLEARGLIKRQPDSTDRRVKKLVLTGRGRRMMREIEARRLRGLPGLDRLSAQDREDLARLLTRILDRDSGRSTSP